MEKLILFFLLIGFNNNTCKGQAIIGNFQTQTHHDTIDVNWFTQSETNVDYFILQRAFTGNAVFSDIDTIIAVGNSTINQYYLYHDVPAIVDTCYLYRLKVVETSGQFTFSSIVVGCVFIPTAVFEQVILNKINIYPNPASGNFVCSVNKLINHGELQILNDLGESIYNREIVNESIFEINLNTIPSGIYLVKVLDGEKFFCRKLIVE